MRVKLAGVVELANPELVSRAAMTLLGAISVRVWATAAVMTGLYAAVLQQINAVQPLPYMVSQAAARGQQGFSLQCIMY